MTMAGVFRIDTRYTSHGPACLCLCNSLRTGVLWSRPGRATLQCRNVFDTRRAILGAASEPDVDSDPRGAWRARTIETRIVEVIAKQRLCVPEHAERVERGAEDVLRLHHGGDPAGDAVPCVRIDKREAGQRREQVAFIAAKELTGLQSYID